MPSPKLCLLKIDDFELSLRHSCKFFMRERGFRLFSLKLQLTNKIPWLQKSWPPLWLLIYLNTALEYSWRTTKSAPVSDLTWWELDIFLTSSGRSSQVSCMHALKCRWTETQPMPYSQSCIYASHKSMSSDSSLRRRRAVPLPVWKKIAPNETKTYHSKAI